MSELHSSPSNSQTPPPGVVASTSQEGVTQEGQTAATTETPSPSILSSQKAEVLEQLLSAKLITPKEYKITFRGTSEKKAGKIQAAAQILAKKLAPVRWKKPSLQFLKNQLSLWYQNTPNKEDFADCFIYLDGKVDEYLTSEEDLAIHMFLEL